MTRFAANISILFRDQPLLDRPAAAARQGFDAIELWWPSPADLAGASIDDLTNRVRDAGVQLVLLNFDAGDMAAGDRGLAADPARVARFRENVPVAIGAAQAMGCRKLNALAGNRIDGVDDLEQDLLLEESIAFAADHAATHGLTVLLEPLNVVDNPRYLLPSTAAALGLIEKLRRQNVRLQLDVYHAAMNGEDVIHAIWLGGSQIGHVQLADVPGRHEPGTGELPIRDILAAFDAIGYDDVVGLEYIPTHVSEPAFEYLAALAAPPPVGSSRPDRAGDVQGG